FRAESPFFPSSDKEGGWKNRAIADKETHPSRSAGRPACGTGPQIFRGQGSDFSGSVAVAFRAGGHRSFGNRDPRIGASGRRPLPFGNRRQCGRQSDGGAGPDPAAGGGGAPPS